MTDSRERRRWLDDERNVTLLYRAVVGLSVALVLGDALYHKHVHYGFEGWFGFYGVYGFLSYVALVVAAREIRKVVKREEDYYD
jgi:hypothetical protein